MEQHLEEVEYEEPKWREDPIESFSDWTIEIISGNNDSEDDAECGPYHVHRNFLAHGSRRSEYFSRLFRSQERFQENQTNSSKIELDPLAAEAFPDMLDYVYGCELSITKSTATALHYLGEYFEITQLRLESLEFCQENISMKNLHTYYTHAERLNDEVVMNLITDYLKAHIHSVHPKHPIVNLTTPPFWLSVLGLDEDQEKIETDDTRRLSKVIANMCMNQSEETLDAETLDLLTGSLNSIDPRVALDFCELIDRYCLQDELEEEFPDLFLLQKRCAGALADNWKKFSVMPLEPAQAEKMVQRSPEFLFDVLVQSSTEALIEVGELSNELADCKKMLAAAQAEKATLLSAAGSFKRLRGHDDPHLGRS